MPDVFSDASNLIVVAVTNAFALSSAVYVVANISGGDVNLAVTFGMAIGGHISIPTALFYWVSQMLASVMASLLLKMIVVEQVKETFYIPSLILIYLTRLKAPLHNFTFWLFLYLIFVNCLPSKNITTNNFLYDAS